MTVVRRPARPLLAAAALIAVISWPTTALAAATNGPSARIVNAAVAGGQIQLVLQVQLPNNVSVGGQDLQVKVGGQSAPITSLQTTARPTAVRRLVILAVDTSGSMTGAPLAAAEVAASDFVHSLPKDVDAGLVSFADHVTVVVKPTADRQAVLHGLTTLRASGQTALYDGVLQAVSVIGQSGDRHVVVLSDGEDNRSKANLAGAVKALTGSGVNLDAIAFNTSATQAATLASISQAGHGSVIQASSAAGLGTAFRAVASTYSPRVSLAVAVPTGRTGATDIHVEVRTPGGIAVADTVVTLPRVVTIVPPKPSAAPSPSPSTTAAAVVPPAAVTTTTSAPAVAPAVSRPVLSKRALYLALGALLVGLLGMLWLAFDSRKLIVTRNRRTAEVARYSLRSRRARQPVVAPSARLAAAASGLAQRAVTRAQLDQQLASLLSRAGLQLPAAEFALLCGLGAFLSALLLTVLAGTLWVGLLVGLPLGFFAPLWVVKFKATRRQKAFSEGLPDTLQLVSGALRSGFSLAQALDSVVRQGQSVVAVELNRALAQTRLGIELEVALEEVGQRMLSEDFQWVVLAISINREVGGNLAEVIDSVAETIRERERLRRHVRALSAEGRLSAYILTAMPIVMGIYLFTFRPQYVKPLYTTGVGLIMSSSCVLMLGIGWFWMRKLVEASE